MSHKTLWGRVIASNILRRISDDIVVTKGLKPKLQILRVGDDPASTVYIKQKLKSAAKCQIDCNVISFDSDVRPFKIFYTIAELNNDPDVHGIILQLPVLCSTKVDVYDLINTIDPRKDVDGENPMQSTPMHIPCTALACLELIKHTGCQLRGSRCVIVGNGRLVGAPLADLLLWTGQATVTTCHEFTKDLNEEVRRADILVSAVGQHNLIKGDWIKPGAVVIDCGIDCVRRGDLSPTERGDGNPDDLLPKGDVEFKAALQRASWVTPVPGGVGPLTVAFLMYNTWQNARISLNQRS